MLPPSAKYLQHAIFVTILVVIYYRPNDYVCRKKSIFIFIAIEAKPLNLRYKDVIPGAQNMNIQHKEP